MAVGRVRRKSERKWVWRAASKGDCFLSVLVEKLNPCLCPFADLYNFLTLGTSDPRRQGGASFLGAAGRCPKPVSNTETA